MPKLINILFFFGRIFAPLYSLAMIIRAWLYRTGIKSSRRLAIPVISVGNLTMGGTGKTPMVIYIVRLLARHGRRPAIISRGYGGSSKEAVNIVANGRDVLMSAAAAGDEPVFLANILKVPVVTGRHRVLTGQYVQQNKLADILVMDDGYQHLALRRDLDIVLFSGRELLGNGQVFPGGPLREPCMALKRAHCFVITGVTSDNQPSVTSFCEKLRLWQPTIPIFQGGYMAAAIIDKSGVSHNLDSLRGVPLLAFCGIARPESFFDLLGRNNDFNIKTRHRFADHHPFTIRDLTKLQQEARAHDCKALLTTEKDMVKLSGYNANLPVWALRVELVMNQEFADFICQKTGRQT
ncbi:MAG: tetraacyldisaccharide 4'-kinase [Deltaproteobacteria bacterium]|nr:tetraacyldisaccharide 4'-kinase [Deltaproteobacteria bacterium]